MTLYVSMCGGGGTEGAEKSSTSVVHLYMIIIFSLLQIEEQDIQDFHSWLEGMSTDPNDPFIQYILNVDVIPCLSFSNKEVCVCVCLCICVCT